LVAISLKSFSGGKSEFELRINELNDIIARMKKEQVSPENGPMWIDSEMSVLADLIRSL
jgi:hypothetical protein